VFTFFSLMVVLKGKFTQKLKFRLFKRCITLYLVTLYFTVFLLHIGYLH